VHRKFSGFVIDGETSIAAGTKIAAGEKEVGEVTSVAALPGPRTVVLGYIRREVATPGREVAIGAAKAKVITLPVDLLGRNESTLERHLA
jgi:glycine cleavage system aminomethyltransferase T